MHYIREKWVRILKSTIILLPTYSFFLIKLVMYWVWGTCPPWYKLFPLRCFFVACMFKWFIILVSFFKPKRLYWNHNPCLACRPKITRSSFRRGILLQGRWCLFSIMFYWSSFFYSASNFRADAVEISA